MVVSLCFLKRKHRFFVSYSGSIYIGYFLMNYCGGLC